MKKSLLFEIYAENLTQARAMVEVILNSPLAAHESAYRGGEYFRSASGDVNLMLQENFVDDDGDHAESAFPQSKFLLYLEGQQMNVDRFCSALLSNERTGKVLRSSTY